ncbi:MAG: BACON domain-containing protein [Verrucomicrobiales bacterium]|nr:BACON domain-containing protein [Verrucomicrobiales bacterium]MCP5525716.1 BACON domain-containing protein [Verrucomicrobiales bacterium]
MKSTDLSANAEVSFWLRPLTATLLVTGLAAVARGAEPSQQTNPASRQLFSTVDPIDCDFELLPAAADYGPGPATGSFEVAAFGGCEWDAGSPGWIHLEEAGGNENFGWRLSSSSSATVTYHLPHNYTGQLRLGSVTVTMDGAPTRSFSISQDACGFELQAEDVAYGVGPAEGTFTVSAPGVCAWHAGSPGWIRLEGAGGDQCCGWGLSSAGDQTVTYSVADNYSGSLRTGEISVSMRGQPRLVFSVSQEACAFELEAEDAFYGPGRADGSFAVTSPSVCRWTASSPGWLRLEGGGGDELFSWSVSSVGDQSVTYHVAENYSGSLRTGEISVSMRGQPPVAFTISQEACAFEVEAEGAFYGPGQAAGSFGVTSPGVCRWTASSPGWIRLEGGGGDELFSWSVSGVGDGTIAYQVAKNYTGEPRTGEIKVSMRGQPPRSFTVSQEPCGFTLLEEALEHGPKAETRSFVVAGIGDCEWTVRSPGWVRMADAAGDPALGWTLSGAGPGIVLYNVADNNSEEPRTSTLSISMRGVPTRILPVTQSGRSCTYTLSLNDVEAPAGGMEGTITVTAATGCYWTPSRGPHYWINVWGASATHGPGHFDYIVSANQTGSERSGAITVGDGVIIVKQSGSPLCSDPYRLDAWEPMDTAPPDCTTNANHRTELARARNGAVVVECSDGGYAVSWHPVNGGRVFIGQCVYLPGGNYAQIKRDETGEISHVWMRNKEAECDFRPGNPICESEGFVNGFEDTDDYLFYTETGLLSVVHSVKSLDRFGKPVGPRSCASPSYFDLAPDDLSVLQEIFAVSQQPGPRAGPLWTYIRIAGVANPGSVSLSLRERSYEVELSPGEPASLVAELLAEAITLDPETERAGLEAVAVVPTRTVLRTGDAATVYLAVANVIDEEIRITMTGQDQEGLRALRTIDVPRLSIDRDGQDVLVSWASSSDKFHLSGGRMANGRLEWTELDKAEVGEIDNGVWRYRTTAAAPWELFRLAW